MKRYIGTREVMARPMTRGDYNTYRGWETPGDKNPQDDGYLVEYAHGGRPNDHRHYGHISWSPADVFHSAYHSTEGLTFGQALEALKAGKRITRMGWNGPNQFLWLKPAARIQAAWCKDPVLREIVEDAGGEIEALGTICMYTVDRSGRRAVLTGWLASQSDMLLDDWAIAP